MKTARRSNVIRVLTLVYAFAASFFFITRPAGIGSLLVLFSGLILLPLTSGKVDFRREKRICLAAALISVLLLASGAYLCIRDSADTENTAQTFCCDGKFVLSDVPEFSGKAYVTLNGNIPYFDLRSTPSEPFERYSPLDEEGRCGAAEAFVCPEIMPTEPRESISSVTPSGWKSTKYDFIDGELLYNRCHLIGYQLSGENANERNIITGTRFLNVRGMLPFENEVASYVSLTGNGVYYRVTPVFSGAELLCRGVVIEAYSPSDDGDGVCFNVFCYNEQPGVAIDHATGDSRASEESSAKAPTADSRSGAYIMESPFSDEYSKTALCGIIAFVRKGGAIVNF